MYAKVLLIAALSAVAVKADDGNFIDDVISGAGSIFNQATSAGEKAVNEITSGAVSVFDQATSNAASIGDRVTSDFNAGKDDEDNDGDEDNNSHDETTSGAGKRAVGTAAIAAAIAFASFI
ncbi:hypothetical protein H4R24_004686 [Coemansia sp. RSA 988]|nr:hypothetical protein H4R24_004686 [Coemansia sp. RSA 988]